MKIKEELEDEDVLKIKQELEENNEPYDEIGETWDTHFPSSGKVSIQTNNDDIGYEDFSSHSYDIPDICIKTEIE